MQPVEIPPELAAELIAIARERGLSVACDTHYDAFNFELQWWKGDQLHRVDFQPCPEGHVMVTSLVNTYPAMGRVLRWARNNIPYFPEVAKTHSIPLGKLGPPYVPSQLRAEINAYVEKAA